MTLKNSKTATADDGPKRFLEIESIVEIRERRTVEFDPNSRRTPGEHVDQMLHDMGRGEPSDNYRVTPKTITLDLSGWFDPED